MAARSASWSSRSTRPATRWAAPVEPPTRTARRHRRDRQPVRRPLCEDLDELIAIGEELGGLLGQRARGGARHRAGRRRRATARRRSSARRASSSMPPRSCIRSSARRCARRSRRAPRWCRRRRSGRRSARAIDVPLGHKDAAFVRSHFDAHRGARRRRAARRTRSWSRSPSPTAAARCRASAGCRRARSRARTGCAEAPSGAGSFFQSRTTRRLHDAFEAR